MAASINEGWRELVDGDDEAAERVFRRHLDEGQRPVEALEGLARVALGRGRAREAESWMHKALEMEQSPRLRLLEGEVAGFRGERREAQRVLQEALSAMDEEDPYARAVLGEQKIRRGNWRGGTEDFVEALHSDHQGDAFTYLEGVILDLVDAHLNGRIPQKQAMRFINQLDYTAPKNHAGMETFFAEARRAINHRQSLSREERATAAAVPAHVREAARGRSVHRGSSEGAHSPGTQRPADSRSTDRRRRPPKPPEQPPKPPEDTGGAGRIDANKKDLQKVIQRERSENANLLTEIAEMGPPDWPSKIGDDNIDTVEPVSLDRGSMLGGTSGIDTRDFRLTSGDLLTQIFLERCLRNLLAATQRNKASNFVLRPQSIPMMELNCRDGLFEQMRPLSRIYEDRPGFDDYRQLALATFIGESLVEAYDGTWNYDTEPARSRLEIGDEVLDPFSLVRDWMEAEDKDDVDLEVIARQAEAASEESTSLIVAQEYIDPTQEMTAEALGSTLAERWVEYRVRLSDVSFAEVANTIEVLQVDEEAVVFKLGARWVPLFARGPDHSGLLADGTVGMAYLRKSGVFAPLASRKAVARLLEVSCDGLDGESAQRAVEVMSTLYRPRWEFAFDDDTARALSERSGEAIEAPQLDMSAGQNTLKLAALSPDGIIHFEVLHRPDELIGWRVEKR